MNEILFDKVSERVAKNPIIVFVHSRRETFKTANYLKDMFYQKDELSKLLQEDSESKKIIQQILSEEGTKSYELK